MYLWNYVNNIVTETKLYNEDTYSNFIFTKDDSELVCCQAQSIFLFDILEDLQLQLKYMWQIGKCDFSTYCPKYQSTFVNDQYGKKRIIFMNPGQTQILIDRKHKPLNFHSTQKANFIASISKKGFIIWDWKNKKQILNTHQWKGNKIILMELEKVIIGSQEEIKVLDIKNLDNIQEIQTIQFRNDIESLSFSSNLQHFVCECQKSIQAWRILNDGLCQQVARYEKELENQKNPVISANNEFIVYKEQECLQLVMIKQLYTKEFNCYKAVGLQYSSDYQNLILLVDGFLNLFTSTLEQIKNELESSIKEQYGKDIKSASIDSIFAILCKHCILIVKIIDKNKLTLIRKIDQNDNLITLDINPLGTLLIASNSIGSIYLWDLTSSNEMDFTNSKQHLKIENQNDKIIDLTFSPNGTQFSAAVCDGSINLYSIDQINKAENNKQNNDNQEQSQIQVQYVQFQLLNCLYFNIS